MNIHSTFLYLGLSLATVSPMLSHAQVTLPVWLQPTWIRAKLSDVPVKNSDRYDLSQNNTMANSGNANLQMNPPMNSPLNSPLNPPANVQMNPQYNTQTLQPQIKQTANLAPVETAVPKLNEKHLTAEELKELRKQLRQQR